MDVTLKVIDGAKKGGKVAVKKPEFVIGRSPECHLCAASSAISRQHCMLIRHEAHLSVKDLGSRNGTLVNGIKIAGEVELATGDELTVGPLKFLVTITPGIANGKLPAVKTVAEAVARAADKPTSGSIAADDISEWLLGTNVLVAGATDTQTIRFDETNTTQLRAAAAQAAVEAVAEGETKALDEKEAADEAAKKSGAGKLPPAPKNMSKDSREAAAEALRAWSRRR